MEYYRLVLKRGKGFRIGTNILTKKQSNVKNNVKILV